ncbi:MAG: hypothetical protein IPM30_16665 [Burkholderiales bacterium]|jgi:hypothetical protein|nr:hypothetical protein [Burkholderiales bacterium]
MKTVRWLVALVLLIAGAAQANELKLTIVDPDPDDLACGLRYPAIQSTVRQSIAVMKAREVAESDYEMLVAIATVKRVEDCASDVIVTVRKIVPLAAGEKFRTRDNKAVLELCRHGGIVVSPIKDHERDFLKQVERSVQVCLGQLAF